MGDNLFAGILRGTRISPPRAGDVVTGPGPGPAPAPADDAHLDNADDAPLDYDPETGGDE
jgi:hypothetical protein